MLRQSQLQLAHGALVVADQLGQKLLAEVVEEVVASVLVFF